MYNGKKMKEQYSVITLNDLSTIISFEEWIKKCLKKYKKDNVVPKGDLEKYLGYIKYSVLDHTGKNKREWIKQIDSLFERLKDDQAK
jgi:hypothetical protein